MTVERIFLACDYSADPTWWDSDGAMAELAELGLGEELRATLRRWADWFELTIETQTLDAHGTLHYFPSDAEEAAFEAEGLRLWHRARYELADRYEVGYASRPAGRRLWDPDDPTARHAKRLAHERAAGHQPLYEQAEQARTRPELQGLLARLEVRDEADNERFDLTDLSTGDLLVILARATRQKRLSASDQSALKRLGWPAFEGRPMPAARGLRRSP
jgi:hypothetical protein